MPFGPVFFIRAVVTACPKLYEIHCPHPVIHQIKTLLQEHGFHSCGGSRRELWRWETRDCEKKEEKAKEREEKKEIGNDEEL